MKKINNSFIVLVAALFILYGCQSEDTNSKNKELDFTVKQTELLLEESYKADKIPRTIDADGQLHWTRDGFDWTEGFFPGTCWYLFEYTKDEKWQKGAQFFQKKYENHRFLPFYHDLGFVFNCSYGNGYRLTGDEHYKQVLIDAGNTLIGRFNPQIGCIKSWDVNKGWQSKRGWEFPVIIDNMMNLEMLFELTEITGDPKYKAVAIAHANTTMKNHFRDDMSSYHVIDYDSITGEVRHKHTAQGFAHESEWARGQAWGIYGYTICYRYTQDPQYLQQAEKIADYIINHPVLPSDKVPYWDYDAAKIPNEPRDASAAAITASALIELDGYSNKNYLNEAKTIIKSLSSKNYLAKIGTNHHFILKHSVGSIPHNNEIDVPLNYADYYYIEALLRLKALNNQSMKQVAQSK